MSEVQIFSNGWQNAPNGLRQYRGRIADYHVRSLAQSCTTLLPDLIAAIASLKPKKVSELIAVFEKVKALCATKTDTNIAELKQLSSLSETELTVLLTLLQKH